MISGYRIAHRSNAQFDRLIVLDKGRIVEFDTPFKLIHKEGGGAFISALYVVVWVTLYVQCSGRCASRVALTRSWRLLLRLKHSSSTALNACYSI